MTDLRSRAAAAGRLPALPGRWGRSIAARDPLLPWPPEPRQPSTYGLTDVELRVLALEHVERVCQRSPELAHVNKAAFVAAVISHWTPLPADRPWLSRRWQARRGEPSWVGGCVGVHVPSARPA